MATKKAIYQYDNGSGWDEIMFKTTADQVVESSSRRFVTDTDKSNWNTAVTRAANWNTFKSSGGDLSGSVYINGGANQRFLGVKRTINSSTYQAILKVGSGGQAIVNCETPTGSQVSLVLEKTSARSFVRPLDNNTTELGFEGGACFKELWLGAFSRGESGYTRLTNGLILQWSTLVIQNSSYSDTRTVTFPIAFPTKVLSTSFQPHDATTCITTTQTNLSRTGLTLTTRAAVPAGSGSSGIGAVRHYLIAIGY